MTTNKDENGLLPCPFCGWDAVQDVYGEAPNCIEIIKCGNENCYIKPEIKWDEEAYYLGDTAQVDLHNIEAEWNTRAQPQNVVGENRPVTKSMDDLLFRLEYWGNFYYEDGCKYAHEILLDYREELHKLVETALSDPKQHQSADAKAALDDVTRITMEHMRDIICDQKKTIAALTAQQPDVPRYDPRLGLIQKEPVNQELLEALKYAFKWMGNANTYDRKVYDKHYLNISNLIQRAEQKGGV